MKLPLGGVLERCKTGFPLWQKMMITGGFLVYAISPIDCLPDVLVPVGFADDAYLFYVVFRVWASPTLIPGGHGNSASQGAGTRTAPGTPVRRAMDEVLR